MSKKRGETVAAKPNWEKLLKPDAELTVASVVAEEVATIREDKEQRILTAVVCTQDQYDKAVKLCKGLGDAMAIPLPSMDEMNEPEKYSRYLENQPRARSRTFIAKPCTLCTALRGKDTNFTRVYATRDRVRYCKCTYCNNTWKDSDS